MDKRDLVKYSKQYGVKVSELDDLYNQALETVEALTGDTSDKKLLHTTFLDLLHSNYGFREHTDIALEYLTSDKSLRELYEYETSSSMSVATDNAVQPKKKKKEIGYAGKEVEEDTEEGKPSNDVLVDPESQYDDKMEESFDSLKSDIARKSNKEWLSDIGWKISNIDDKVELTNTKLKAVITNPDGLSFVMTITNERGDLVKSVAKTTLWDLLYVLKEV